MSALDTPNAGERKLLIAMSTTRIQLRRRESTVNEDNVSIGNVIIRAARGTNSRPCPRER